MKKIAKLLFLLLVLLIPFIFIAGCDSNKGDPESDATASNSADESDSDVVFSYSDGIDENGFWKGVKALDYVDNLDFLSMTIPADVHKVSDEQLQYQVDTLMSGYLSRKQITNRAVVYGDSVNIDYEGKIDGVVFEGGSTMSVGVDAIIGASDDIDNTESFLDSFLEELIGHKPGETIDIEVTFPADYSDENIQGKTAVFSTTINYIVEIEELNDAFVEKNLSSTYGWTTVEEMIKDMRAGIQEDLIQQYIEEFLRTEVPVKSIPDSLMEYQEKALLNSYQEYADFNGMELEEYLKEYESFSSVDECIEAEYSVLVENATFLLVIQAVAEDMGMSVSEEDLTNYSVEHLWSSDYSIQVDQYGLPYVKQSVICQMVLDYIAENAVLS